MAKMTTYISLLRGINVGGQKKIPMNQLVALYDETGFKNIKTYVNSGNVVFDYYSRETNSLAKVIELKIKEKFNLNVPVLIRSIDELEKTIANNPFFNTGDDYNDKLYVTFLSEQPGNAENLKISNILPGSDKFVIIDKEVYLYIPGFYSRTKFSNYFFEKYLKAKATTRNWNTVVALFDLAKRK